MSECPGCGAEVREDERCPCHYECDQEIERIRHRQPARLAITKRELFAIEAMQGILASWPEHAKLRAEETALVSIGFADALIAKLEAGDDE